MSRYILYGSCRAVHVLGYMPYGETLLNLSHTHYETPYQFTGYEKDQESGLYYAGARYQVPRLGSFNSTDELWHLSPDKTSYHYCSNNPIMFVDPDGREPELINGVWFTEIANYKHVRPCIAYPMNFTTTARNNNLLNYYDYTINTQQFSLFGIPQGQTVYNGKIVAGTSAPEFYYASFKDGKFTFGQGDVPPNSDFGIGGGIPILINGRKYTGNGDFQGYNNQNKREIGKSIFAYNSKNGNIMLISQQDGANGMTMDEIRDYIFNMGFDNAISFDGSGSATFVQDKKLLVSPDWYRRPLIPIGMTISEPRNNNITPPFIQRCNP